LKAIELDKLPEAVKLLAINKKLPKRQLWIRPTLMINAIQIKKFHWQDVTKGHFMQIKTVTELSYNLKKIAICH